MERDLKDYKKALKNAIEEDMKVEFKKKKEKKFFNHEVDKKWF